MAVTRHPLLKSIRIKVNTNTQDSKGNDIYKNVSFSKVKTSAIADNTFAVATAIAAVMSTTVDSYMEIDTVQLMNA